MLSDHLRKSLKKLMREKNLSARALANASGVCRSVINKILGPNNGNIGTRSLEMLANYFNVSLFELFFYSEQSSDLEKREIGKIGEVMTELMKKKGLSVQKVHALTGIPRATLYNVITQGTPPQRMDQLFTLMEFFNVSADEILFGSNELRRLRGKALSQDFQLAYLKCQIRFLEEKLNEAKNES